MAERNKSYQSTYQYKEPIRFMGVEYTDSRSLAEAYMENWDIAVSAVYCNGRSNLFYRYEDEYEPVVADVRFSMYLHQLEPALPGIPFIRAEDDEAKLYSVEEFGDWLLAIADADQWDIYEYGDTLHGFDTDSWNRTLVYYAAKLGMFSSYVPGVKEAQENFRKADAKQKCLTLRELALELQGKGVFRYGDVLYNSIEELAPLVKKHLRERTHYFWPVFYADTRLPEFFKDTYDAAEIRLFTDLFENSEYKDSFDRWLAKVDGGKHQKEFLKLKNDWLKLNEIVPLPDGKKTLDKHIDIKYSFYDSLLEQFPLRDTKEMLVLLRKKHKEALEKITPIQYELLYRQTEERVYSRIIRVGLLSAEDMEELGCLKETSDWAECLKAYLEHEEAYCDALGHVIACLDEKRLASGWDKAGKEERRLLLAAGWYSLPSGETNQGQALFKKVKESWQKEKDPSLLVEALGILLSVLEKGFSGGWAVTSTEGMSAYEECLELIDGIAALCAGVKHVELEKHREKIREIINDRVLAPIEQAFSGFSDKYNKDYGVVKSIEEKSGCLESPKPFLTRIRESKKPIYFQSFIAEIKETCQRASDYLSEYKGQIANLKREMSAIKEGGCHYGKLRENFEAHKRFMANLKEAEDALKKSFADFDSVIEGIRSRMVEELTQKAEQHDAEAQCRLGDIYNDGWGGAEDKEKADGWYKRAARQGNKEAQDKMINRYRKEFEQCEKAAGQGDMKAQCKLGDMYYNGEGVIEDDKKAFEWYDKAARQGYAEAKRKLGDMYWNGYGVDKDRMKAAIMYDIAAKQGDKDAFAKVLMCKVMAAEGKL